MMLPESALMFAPWLLPLPPEALRLTTPGQTSCSTALFAGSGHVTCAPLQLRFQTRSTKFCSSRVEVVAGASRYR